MHQRAPQHWSVLTPMVATGKGGKGGMSSWLAVAKQQLAGSPAATPTMVVAGGPQGAAVGHIWGVQHLHCRPLFCSAL